MLWTVQLLCALLVCLIFIPAGAHFFEMPSKLALSPEAYMTVQSIYYGWALLGILIFSGAHPHPHPHDHAARPPGGFRLVARLVSPHRGEASDLLALHLPHEPLEYSHAVNVGLTLAAFAALMVAILASRRPTLASGAIVASS